MKRKSIHQLLDNLEQVIILCASKDLCSTKKIEITKLKNEFQSGDPLVILADVKRSSYVNVGKKYNVSWLTVSNFIKQHFPTEKIVKSKIDWPSNENIIKMLESKSKRQLAKELGVTATSINKRLKKVS